MKTLFIFVALIVNVNSFVGEGISKIRDASPPQIAKAFVHFPYEITEALLFAPMHFNTNQLKVSYPLIHYMNDRDMLPELAMWLKLKYMFKSGNIWNLNHQCDLNRNTLSLWVKRLIKAGLIVKHSNGSYQCLSLKNANKLAGYSGRFNVITLTNASKSLIVLKLRCLVHKDYVSKVIFATTHERQPQYRKGDWKQSSKFGRKLIEGKEPVVYLSAKKAGSLVNRSNVTGFRIKKALNRYKWLKTTASQPVVEFKDVSLTFYYQFLNYVATNSIGGSYFYNGNSIHKRVPDTVEITAPIAGNLVYKPVQRAIKP